MAPLITNGDRYWIQWCSPLAPFLSPFAPMVPMAKTPNRYDTFNLFAEDLSCIRSPPWNFEYPSVGLKVLLLTLMLPQHTEKMIKSRSDRHEPWKKQ